MQVNEYAMPKLVGLDSSGQADSFGSVYTPEALANWVAAELLEYASRSPSGIRRALDPACGNGILLDAIRRLAPAPIDLVGIDLDRVAAAQCWSNLAPPTDIRVGDALDPTFPWSSIEPPNLIIMNPPWGTPDAHERDRYRKLGYELAVGQFDIFELFVERALRTVPKGGHIALILPDSVFESEHQPLRKFILNHTLLLVARLGEGMFPDIFRGTVVVILRVGAPSGDHLVECLLVPPTVRKSLNTGKLNLERIKGKYSHMVPQERFIANRRHVFDINNVETDTDVLQKYKTPHRFDWQRHVVLARGIEIGRDGETIRCSNCGIHRAIPIRPPEDAYVVCRYCDARTEFGIASRRIVANEAVQADWYPLIVGRDVDRYSVVPSRFIELGVTGIRYKPMEHFQAKKLLFRKTGVGLRAAVDESHAAVNQSVFYVVAQSANRDWLLDYLEGIINSRPMLAWHLAMTGENQWRSFPYWTATKLKELPIPDPDSSGDVTGVAKSVAKLARQARRGDIDAELGIDELVSQLYALEESEKEWVGGLLASAQQSLKYFSDIVRTSHSSKLEAPE